MTAVVRPAGAGRRAGMGRGRLLQGGEVQRPPKPPLTWRGHGGASATPNTVEFDKQLDKISMWIEHWNHETRCMILEKLLRESSYVQLRLLWTVLQPALHRDFMYTASKQYPTENFVPISSYTGRDIVSRLSKEDKIDFHRVNSAHIQLSVARGGHDVTLPALCVANPTSSMERMTTSSCRTRTGRSTQHSNYTSQSPSRMSRMSQATKSSTLSKSSTISKSTRVSMARSDWSRATSEDSGIGQSTRNFNQGAPQSAPSPCIRFIEMPVRRHMQEESSPRRSAPYDVYDDVTPVGGDTAAPVVPVLANKWQDGWKTPLPVPMTPNLAAPTTDTPRVQSKVRLRLKVNLKAAQSGQLTMTNSKEKDTNINESHLIRMNTSERPKEVVRVSASLDIPTEGWQLLHWYTSTWNAVQRNEFLHKLLIKLDPRQHYYMSSLLSVKHHVDIVGLLPDRLALRIVSYLGPRDLLIALRVSKRWFKLCNNNGIWKGKCQETKLDIPVTSPNPNWKAAFKDNKSIVSNWSTGNCTVVECKGHHQKVLSVIFDGNKMATGSADKSIKIWDVHDGKCLQTLKGHEKGVWALRFFTDTLLISASYDSTLRVWNMKEGTCLRTLIGHGGPVWAIERVGNTLVSASQDGTAKVWDISRCLLQRSLRGHGGPVFCVDLDEGGKVAVTGSSDRTVRLWSTESGRQLRLIWVPGNSVMAVSYSRNWIAASHGTCVSLYESNGKLHSTFDGHSKRVECLELKIKDPDQPQGLIISAGKDGIMKQWDIAKGECTKTFVVSKTQVNCVRFDEMRIASAASDNKIKLWDFTIPKTSHRHLDHR